MTEWFGPDFDGVIAFDEAHLMKNAAGTLHGGKARPLGMLTAVALVVCFLTSPLSRNAE